MAFSTILKACLKHRHYKEYKAGDGGCISTFNYHSSNIDIREK
jgi:hypothetical protein